MPKRQDNMRAAQGLLAALEGVNVTPPAVLKNVVDGFGLLGDPVQPAAADPANAILAAAVDGKLTPKSLDALLATAAAETATNNYRQEFRLRAARQFAVRFHAALIDGAADQVLDEIRPQFESVAQELVAARDAVDLNVTPQRLLDVSATPEEQDAWRRLPNIVRQISQLAAIAAAFGPHANLAVVDDLTDHDSLLRLGWLDDRAVMCCAGDVVTTTNTFRQPDPTWQTSPWLRATLELQTIASAQERYREVAESDWAHRNRHFEGDGTLTDDGFVPHVRTNPHALPESVDA